MARSTKPDSRRKVRCKGIAKVGESHPRPCSKNADKGLPYCWPHGEQASDAVAALDTYPSEDFIMNHLTLRKQHFEKQLIRFSPKRKAPLVPIPLDNSRAKVSLGAMENLPLEVLCSILSYLPLPDLRKFRATNSRACVMVSSDTHFQSVVTNAPDLIAALYGVDLASQFSLGRIFDVLTQSRCEVCDRFAAYVFLPGLQRCCQRCVVYEDDFVPVALDLAVKYCEFEIEKESARRLPRMLFEDVRVYTQVNRYDGSLCYQDVRPYVVSKAEARRLRVPIPTNISFRIHPERPDYDAVMSVPCLQPEQSGGGNTEDRGYHCLGCAKATCGGETLNCGGSGGSGGCQCSRQGGIDEPISMGWIGVRSCRVAMESHRLYSKAEVLDHVSKCINVQDLLADWNLERARPVRGMETKERKKFRKYPYKLS